MLVEGDRVVFELALPVGGVMSTRPSTELAQSERRLQALLAARGHTFHDPIYTLLFLTADFLPSVRLTADGVWDVKRGASCARAAAARGTDAGARRARRSPRVGGARAFAV